MCCFVDRSIYSHQPCRKKGNGAFWFSVGVVVVHMLLYDIMYNNDRSHAPQQQQFPRVMMWITSTTLRSEDTGANHVLLSDVTHQCVVSASNGQRSIANNSLPFTLQPPHFMHRLCSQLTTTGNWQHTHVANGSTTLVGLHKQTTLTNDDSPRPCVTKSRLHPRDRR